MASSIIITNKVAHAQIPSGVMNDNKYAPEHAYMSTVSI